MKPLHFMQEDIYVAKIQKSGGRGGGRQKYQFSIVATSGSIKAAQFSSVSQSCPTLQPHGLQHARLLSPSPTSSLISKLMSIKQVMPSNQEPVMPSNHLILCHPLLLLPSIFPSIRVFSNKLVLPIRWPKYWSFSFSISPSNEYSGLISFRIDQFDLLAIHPRDSQESSPAPQFKSINSLALSFLYGPTFTSIHDYQKNHIF